MSAPSSNDLPQKSPRPSTELKPMPGQKEKTREEELAREREATRAIQIALAMELNRGSDSRPYRDPILRAVIIGVENTNSFYLLCCQFSAPEFPSTVTDLESFPCKQLIAEA
ncbi:hypothetical protein FCIRC_7188 [Fusarium circinatum]|uniref:Uncharacterized protein n=1 Tax=Fusarium circinatum TaxID=48490 RepID=A0A8H5TXR9_FUSCI|nr:hypothetical protein FCIRC_7188 [Fusarium circinatum]